MKISVGNTQFSTKVNVVGEREDVWVEGCVVGGKRTVGRIE